MYSFHHLQQKQSLISRKMGIDGTVVSRGCRDYTMSLISIKSDALHFFVVAEQLSIAVTCLPFKSYHRILGLIVTATRTNNSLSNNNNGNTVFYQIQLNLAGVR